MVDENYSNFTATTLKLGFYEFYAPNQSVNHRKEKGKGIARTRRETKQD